LTWAAEFYLWRNGGLENPSVQLFLMGIMLIPAISVFLTRWATGEGFHDMWLRLDIKKNYRIYLAAWLGPCVLIILGSVIYFLLFRSNFDPEMTVLRESMKTVQTEEPAEITTKVLIYTILTQCLISVVFAPILNIVPSLGEEIGWRGYLLPKLNTMFSRKKTVLLTGLIWGVWHAPIVAMGYNYGKNYFGYPFFGILAMIVFCIVVGSFFSWLAFSVHSAIPSAIAHGALNGFASIGIFFLKDSPAPFLGPYPTGIIGGIGFIVVGFLCFRQIEKAGVKAEIAENVHLEEDMA
jgi:membrane protease YdiL (CAAX protease family)